MKREKRIGFRIKDARESKGWTLDDLAKRLMVPVSVPTLSRMENGRISLIEVLRLVALEEALEIRFDDLIKGEKK